MYKSCSMLHESRCREYRNDSSSPGHIEQQLARAAWQPRFISLLIGLSSFTTSTFCFAVYSSAHDYRNAQSPQTLLQKSLEAFDLTTSKFKATSTLLRWASSFLLSRPPHLTRFPRLWNECARLSSRTRQSRCSFDYSSFESSTGGKHDPAARQPAHMLIRVNG